MTSSPTSSSKRHRLPSEEKENDQQDNKNDGLNKKMKKILDDPQKIRLEIIEEFHKRNLEIPVHMIDAIDRSKTSETNRNDTEHRKELYRRLSEYLDHRQVRNRGQTYIFPDLIHQLIRSRFPSGIRDYQTVKTFKNGKLNNVSEEDKYYVQWEDFCKKNIK